LKCWATFTKSAEADERALLPANSLAGKLFAQPADLLGSTEASPSQRRNFRTPSVRGKVFGKSWDRLCALWLKAILVVADSHSNRDERPNATFVFAEKPTLHPTFIQSSVGAAISRENSDATTAMSAATNGGYSRRDFPNALS